MNIERLTEFIRDFFEPLKALKEILAIHIKYGDMEQMRGDEKRYLYIRWCRLNKVTAWVCQAFLLLLCMFGAMSLTSIIVAFVDITGYTLLGTWKQILYPLLAVAAVFLYGGVKDGELSGYIGTLTVYVLFFPRLNRFPLVPLGPSLIIPALLIIRSLINYPLISKLKNQKGFPSFVTTVMDEIGSQAFIKDEDEPIPVAEDYTPWNPFDEGDTQSAANGADAPGNEQQQNTQSHPRQGDEAASEATDSDADTRADAQPETETGEFEVYDPYSNKEAYTDENYYYYPQADDIPARDSVQQLPCVNGIAAETIDTSRKIPLISHAFNPAGRLDGVVRRDEGGAQGCNDLHLPAQQRGVAGTQSGVCGQGDAPLESGAVSGQGRKNRTVFKVRKKPVGVEDVLRGVDGRGQELQQTEGTDKG